MTSKADISNAALRVFLEQIGAEYDKERGYQPYKGGIKGADFQQVSEFFGHACCYCGTKFSGTTKPCQDHLVPINKSECGLHAWGNIVPACRECNAEKHGRDWKEFILARAAKDIDHQTQAKRIKQYVSKYKYDPATDVADAAESLYIEVGEVATTLIKLKINRVSGAM